LPIIKQKFLCLSHSLHTC